MVLNTYMTHSPSAVNDLDRGIEGMKFTGRIEQIEVQLEVTYWSKITLNSDAFAMGMAELTGAASENGTLENSFDMDVSGGGFLGSTISVTMSWLTGAFPDAIFFLTNCKVELN